MNNKQAMISHWKNNRDDALRRGMLKEVDRINKILLFYGNFDN
ncbi:MAG: hypothetical protein ABIG84_02510 [archaeon]